MSQSPAGRFAPSPSADLHIGNVRTAVLAWLFARSTGRRFLVRVEDLDDRTFADVAQRQLADLAAVGLTWDEPPQYQTAHEARGLGCTRLIGGLDHAFKDVFFDTFAERESAEIFGHALVGES